MSQQEDESMGREGRGGVVEGAGRQGKRESEGFRRALGVMMLLPLFFPLVE